MKNVVTAATLLLCSLALTSCGGGSQAPGSVTVQVTNPSQRDRQEVVALPLDTATVEAVRSGKLACFNSDGAPVTTQVTHDGLVLLDVQIAAGQTLNYSLSAPAAKADSTVYCYGKLYPERVDDIAWENDRIAFRAYGPALQKSGEKAYGYDVWTKSVSEVVVPQRYAEELNPETQKALAALRETNPDSAKALTEATSYHYDHGNGLDCYKVGPTLGGGANAIARGDSLLYPYCYDTAEILDNGPLRFCARLTYKPFLLDGVEVTEERLLTLDAHSQLNSTAVQYKGLTSEVTVAAGPVVHDANGGAHKAAAEAGYVAYADSTDRPGQGFGTIFVGAVFPNTPTEAKLVLFGEAEAQERGAFGHVLAYTPLKPDSTFTYHWGAGWSKYGFASLDEWAAYLATYKQNLAEPLQVTVK